MTDGREELTGAGESMKGRRLYSPGTLAAYTALANLPVGFVLYGLNLKARGRRRIGFAMLLIGVASFVLFALKPSDVRLPFSWLFVIGVAGALNVYYLERRPFAQAIRDGAAPARWWPPAIFLLVLFLADLYLKWSE